MNPVGEKCWQKALVYPCKETLGEVMRDFLQDYIDIVNSVQRQSKFNSAYCLQVDKNVAQYFRFHYTFDEGSVTFIKYNKVNNIVGISFRSENVAKRNKQTSADINIYSYKGREQIFS